MGREFKLLETEKYYYKVYAPICDEDEAAFLQINKKTNEQRWVALSMDGIWKELDNAHLIGTYNFDESSDVEEMIKKH